MVASEWPVIEATSYSEQLARISQVTAVSRRS
jgi:hypothetical protein